MGGAMQVIGVVLGLCLAVLQFAAMLAGADVLFGAHWLLLVPIVFVLTTIPLVGTVLGIVGAVQGGGWAWWEAGLLFFGMMAATLVFAGLAGLGGLWENYRSRRPT